MKKILSILFSATVISLCTAYFVVLCPAETVLPDEISTDQTEPDVKVYVPRLTAPELDDPHWYSTENPYTKNNYGLPNCTCYAYGRTYELLGEKPKGLTYGNADYWFGGKDGYPRGQVPVLGAIACWDGGDGVGGNAGHVAIVEDVLPNGSVVISESIYKGAVFRTRTIANITSLNGWQGFIYIYGAENIVPAPDECSESYSGSYVTTDKLNLRSGHGTAYSSYGTIPKGTQIWVSKSDGAWAHTTYNGNDGYVSMDYIKPVPKNEYNGAGLYKVNTTSLNVRTGAAASYESIGILTNGTYFIGKRNVAGWINLIYGEQNAYVNADFVLLAARPDMVKAAADLDIISADRQALFNWARAQVVGATEDIDVPDEPEPSTETELPQPIPDPDTPDTELTLEQ
ncbi:MAG: SH3 domain-containing protein [Oscillospiraceae bacterium]|jgi:surface antigen/uncharacterized protein YraI|nr:SH3 domain-containing protein [Oscillospiraceae bacterium]